MSAAQQLALLNTNATFDEPVGLDRATQVSYAMDLLPLVHAPQLDMASYVGGLVTEFRNSVEATIGQFANKS